ncbi:unnamed protein product [Calypogeia fissa]
MSLGSHKQVFVKVTRQLGSKPAGRENCLLSELQLESVYTSPQCGLWLRKGSQLIDVVGVSQADICESNSTTRIEARWARKLSPV